MNRPLSLPAVNRRGFPGVRVRFSIQDDGSFSLRFDSVNSCPIPLFRKILEQSPDIQISGAALDEDAGIAVFFASEELDVISMESEDESELRRAHEIVYDHPPEPEETFNDP